MEQSPSYIAVSV